MSSKIEISKKCEWCGNVFIARKSSTSYCSHRCSNLAYKEKIRQQRLNALKDELSIKERTKQNAEFKDKEYLFPIEAARLLGISKATIYRYLEENMIISVRFKGKTFIRKYDIQKLFDNPIPYKKRTPKSSAPITEFYTTAEIKEQYGVKESWLYKIAKDNNIPKTFSRGKTYWSKKHIDAYFEKKAPNPDVIEWYSVAEIQEKFGMTLSAIYSFVSKNVIPKKKEGITVCYSKKHFDIAKGVAEPEKPQYYTIPEAMEKFNLTRDQLYHYVKYHNITRIKVGKYTKISKPELDEFLAPPQIKK